MKSITVAHLIELLQNEDPDARVIVSADYGDRSHTEQALPLRGELETVSIIKSSYSSSGWAVQPDYVPADSETYLVLR